MKKLFHCQIPYLVKSHLPFSDTWLTAIHSNYFVFCKRRFPYVIFIDKHGCYFIHIQFVDDRGIVVSLYFRIRGKRAFGCCPFGKISDFISLMYSEYVSRTNN